MAGHSKWANIKFRKERVDAKKGKAFSRAVKEIAVAARTGGGDPNSNPRLRLALAKGKEINLPRDNIDKAIKRGTGQLEGAKFEEIRYEGYGPEAVALIVDCLTDNRNRAAAEVRRLFNSTGGNLGTDGSVSYLFDRVGQYIYAPDCDCEATAMAAIEFGASDYEVESDGSMEVIAPPELFHEVLTMLEKKGLAPTTAALVLRPQIYTPIPEARASKIRKLLDLLEENDDVKEVYCNASFELSEQA